MIEIRDVRVCCISTISNIVAPQAWISSMRRSLRMLQISLEQESLTFSEKFEYQKARREWGYQAGGRRNTH